MVNLVSFNAAFNAALIARKRSFSVKKSFAISSFVRYLYRAGYITGYHISGGDTLTLYPNYNSVLHKRFTIVSTNSRPIHFDANYVLKLYKKGFTYLFYYNGIFFDSQTAVLNKKGGFVLGFFE